ncbi:SH3 domain-containing protein [Litoreibacter meonggei]|uniref:SH3 domain-containing protein n=1 Tax=Litoreibacter meonggei TaxID=1049199 RepID=A0A497VRS9_9RHOB|nr:SH3 domain-containing protein [Litoreibacter meonggei]RLJ40779.1 SH3 domain-containing protein [Litoreibacter meonggei]
MFKWVVGLCATMYLILITVGEPTGEELALRKIISEQEVTRATSTKLDTPVIQVSADIDPPEMPVSAAVTPAIIEIESAALVSTPPDATAPAAVELVTTQEITSVTPEVKTVIRRVTGKRVNLRTRPSTTAEILGRTVRGDSAEIIEMLPSGWAKVYILEAGIEAYMSAKFLSDAG